MSVSTTLESDALRLREERARGPRESVIEEQWCIRCGLPIIVGGCRYNCPLTQMKIRPAGSVIVRTYRRVEELVSLRTE